MVSYKTMRFMTLTDKDLDVCCVAKTPRPDAGLLVTDTQMAHTFDALFYVTPWLDPELFNLSRPYIPCCDSPTEVSYALNNGCKKIWLADANKFDFMIRVFDCEFYVECELDRISYYIRRGGGIFLLDDTNAEIYAKVIFNLIVEKSTHIPPTVVRLKGKQ